MGGGRRKRGRKGGKRWRRAGRERGRVVLEDKHGIFKATKSTGRKKGGVKRYHTHLGVALIQMNGPCRVLQGGTVV